MLYIQKQRTPEIIKQASLAIAHTPDSGYDAITLPKDSEQLQKLEKQLEENQIAEPYIGVRLYFYRRKYGKLKQ